MTVYAHNNYLDADLEVVGSYVQSGQDRLIYADALPAFARILKDRIKHNLQNVIVITGGTGSGKSTLAINLCIEVGRALGERWQLAPNYIYSTDDLRAKLRQPDSCSSINLFDEGSVSLNSNNSQRSEDKMMVVLFDTMRSLGWTSVICIPHIDSLNKRIRYYHMDYHIRCPNSPLIRGYERRGFAQIYRHELRDFGKPYDKLIATTTFKPLTPKISEEYATIKRQHQQELIEKFLAGDDEL